MSVVLTWRSSKELEIGGVGFTTNRRSTQQLKNVVSYGYSTIVVGGETEGLSINQADQVFHDLPVDWNRADAIIPLPIERLVQLSLPETLKDIIRGLGGDVRNDELWVASLKGGNAQVGKSYFDSFRVVALGELGLLTIVPNK